MRNPWGHEIYKGDWSDTSELWTVDLAAEVNLVEKDDGVFYMSIEDYYTEFQATWVNWPTETMHEAHILVQDDQADSPGSFEYCGSTCTRHEYYVNSEVAQTLYISAHTWPGQTYTKACRPFFLLYNIIEVEGSDGLYGWLDGSVDVPPLKVKANSQTKITIELDWDDFLAREVTRDFSLIVYGSDGAVRLTPSDEVTKAGFKTIERIGDI